MLPQASKEVAKPNKWEMANGESRKCDMLNASPMAISKAGFYDPLFSNCHDVLGIKFPLESTINQKEDTSLERLWKDMSLTDKKTAFVNTTPFNTVLSIPKQNVPQQLHNDRLFTEKELLTAYQIDAIKFLMETSPALFANGIEPVLKIVVNWERANAQNSGIQSSGGKNSGAQSSGALNGGALNGGAQNGGAESSGLQNAGEKNEGSKNGEVKE